jgi:hypothetical protein
MRELTKASEIADGVWVCPALFHLATSF